MKYNNSWHLLQNEDVLRELSTDMYKGLTTEEAKRRRHRNGENSIWHVSHTSARDVAIATLFDLATLLLVVSAVAAAFLDKSYEAGAIVAVLIIGAIIRTVAYIRADRILEGVAKEKIPVSSVLRDGRIKILTAGEIVLGDVIFLEEGDTVPCDGRVVSGEDSIVSERGITENKTPVHKFNTVIKTDAESGEVPCEFRSNMLFAGSVVLSGAVRIVATACGSDALVSMKHGGINIDPTAKIPVVEKLKNRSRNISLIMLACVMVLTALSLFIGEGSSLPDVFLGSMAMAAAAMGEFLMTIGYIIVAVAIREAAAVEKHDGQKSRAVFRDPSKIEDVADPDIMVFCGSSFFRSGRAELHAYRNKYGYTDCMDDLYEARPQPEELLTYALSASAGATMGMAAGGDRRRMGEMASVVVRAADAYTRKIGHPLKYSYSPIDHSSSIREQSDGLDTSTVLIDDVVWAVSCGAIDSVMKCCSTYESEEGTPPITREFEQTVYTEAAKLELGGARVIAVAKRRSSYTRLDKPALVTQYMTFVGFFAVAQEQENEADMNAHDAVEYLRSRGVRPILFTETPDADLYYLHRLGLFNKKTKLIKYGDLDRFNYDALDENGMIVSFAQLENAYLSSAYVRAVKIINRGLKKAAEYDYDESSKPRVSVVGMDVGDSGALSRANTGYAVVRSKYRNVPESLLKNAAAVIDTSDKRCENGFGGIIGIVRSVKAACRMLRNIESAKRYLTVSQCARIVVMLAAILFGIPLMNAVFILLWGLIFDFTAVLVMAFERSDGGKLESTRARSTLLSVIGGIAWGSATAATVPLADIIAKLLKNALLTDGQMLSIMTASIIIAGVVISAELIRPVSLTARHKLNLAQFLFSFASILMAMLILFTGFGASVIGGENCGWYGSLAFVPGALAFLILEIGKLLFKKKQK